VFSSLVTLAGAGVSWAGETYTNISVSAQAEISDAGTGSIPDSSGVAPVEVSLPTDSTVLTMSSVAGTISLNLILLEFYRCLGVLIPQSTRLPQRHHCLTTVGWLMPGQVVVGQRPEVDDAAQGGRCSLM
jgi:hypothetical protein